MAASVVDSVVFTKTHFSGGGFRQSFVMSKGQQIDRQFDAIKAALRVLHDPKRTNPASIPAISHGPSGHAIQDQKPPHHSKGRLHLQRHSKPFRSDAMDEKLKAFQEEAIPIISHGILPNIQPHQQSPVPSFHDSDENKSINLKTRSAPSSTALPLMPKPSATDPRRGDTSDGSPFPFQVVRMSGGASDPLAKLKKDKSRGPRAAAAMRRSLRFAQPSVAHRIAPVGHSFELCGVHVDAESPNQSPRRPGVPPQTTPPQPDEPPSILNILQRAATSTSSNSGTATPSRGFSSPPPPQAALPLIPPPATAPPVVADPKPSMAPAPPPKRKKFGGGALRSNAKKFNVAEARDALPNPYRVVYDLGDKVRVRYAQEVDDSTWGGVADDV